jgi:5-formyltetrahydrofolate cyclo-ligase
MPEYQKARNLSVYLSMPSGEISTKDVVKHSFQESKRVYIPLTYKLAQPVERCPASIMDMVELRSWEDFEALKPDKWGIPTPSRDSIGGRRNCFGGMGKSQGMSDREPLYEGLDLIVMPGLAFDRGLGRLGHGKGYYDFFLQRYLSHTQHAEVKMPFLGKHYSICRNSIHADHLASVGIALNEQVLPAQEAVPSDATDFKLDALILGNGELLLPDDSHARKD